MSSEWVRVESKSKPGKFYYYNTKSGQSTFQKPVGVSASVPVVPPRPEKKTFKYTAKVILKIVRGRRLNYKNKKKTCYCKVVAQSRDGTEYKNLGKEMSTKLALGSLEPCFNETFEWPSNGDLIDRILIRCYKREPLRFSDKPLGELYLQMGVVKQQQNHSWGTKADLVRSKEANMVTGSLEVSVKYTPGGEIVMNSDGSSMPTNVRRVGHVGLTSDGLLDLKTIPESWIQLFKTAGISKKQVKQNNRAVTIVLKEFGYISNGGGAANRKFNGRKIEEEAKDKGVPALFARMLFDHEADGAGGLALQKGAIVELYEDKKDGFWIALDVEKKQRGLVQADYMEVLFPMIDGWEEVEEPDNPGSFFYHNAESGETKWDRPSDNTKIGMFLSSPKAPQNLKSTDQHGKPSKGDEAEDQVSNIAHRRANAAKGSRAGKTNTQSLGSRLSVTAASVKVLVVTQNASATAMPDGGQEATGVDKKFEKFGKYRKMKIMKIPDGAIRGAMTRDGISASAIDEFFQAAATSAAAPVIVPRTKAPNAVQQQTPPQQRGAALEGTSTGKLVKYKKMKSMKIPDGAIRGAMMRDGIPASAIDEFFRPMPTETQAPAVQVSPPAQKTAAAGTGFLSEITGFQKGSLKKKSEQRLSSPGEKHGRAFQGSPPPAVGGFLSEITGFKKGKLKTASSRAASRSEATGRAAGSGGGFLSEITSFQKGRLKSGKSRTSTSKGSPSPGVKSPAQGGGFLSDIAGFKKGKLKSASSRVIAPPSKPSGGGSGKNFLAQISGFKRGNMKKAKDRKLKEIEPKDVNKGGDIFSALQGAIGNLRRAINSSDDEEEEDDDDWE